MKKYEYNGKLYTTKELAILSGLSLSCIYSRLKKGIPIKDIVEIPKIIKQNVKSKYTCTYNGKIIDINEVSKITGIHKDTIYHKINRGKTLQEIIDNPQIRKIKKYKFRDKEFTVCELERLTGISRFTIRKYLKNNSVSNLIIANIGKQKYKRFLYKGKKYSFEELLQLPECVVNRLTLANRIYKGKWDIEEAITKPKKQTALYFYNGKEYTLQELVNLPDRKVGINTFYTRLYVLKWDVKRALTEPAKRKI